MGKSSYFDNNVIWLHCSGVSAVVRSLVKKEKMSVSFQVDPEPGFPSEESEVGSTVQYILNTHIHIVFNISQLILEDVFKRRKKEMGSQKCVKGPRDPAA